MSKFYSRYGKRLLDLSLSLPALVVLSPLIVSLALAVRLTQGAPVLFRQRRPGLRGQPFVLLKFRTMRDAPSDQIDTSTDAARITMLGRLLRSTSLDELPELFNVLRGELSLVGPRPLLMQYLTLYSPDQLRRHDVKPGITGCAQVHGRNALSWPQKFALDLWYVDHVSLRLDIQIMLVTLWKIVTREGINQTGHGTVELFRGN